jgi:hypothetical protein
MNVIVGDCGILSVCVYWECFVFRFAVVGPIGLYGCETWSLTLREECRLSVFENRVLRRIFRPRRDEVTGEKRRLHNEELYALYPSPDIIREIKLSRLRWAGHVVRMGRGEVHTGF